MILDYDPQSNLTMHHSKGVCGMDLEVPAAILEGRSQKELDDEIKKKKEKQVFFWNSKSDYHDGIALFTETAG